MAQFQATAEQKKYLALLMRTVLDHPDLVDDIAEATGQDISDDPAEMVLQLVHASVMNPKGFDAAVMNYQADLGVKNFALGGALLAAGSAIGGLFKNKDSAEGATGFIGNIFNNVKGKLGDWKDRRQVKKALKNSGDPNWREQWRDMKKPLKAAQAGGMDVTTLLGGDQARPEGEPGGEPPPDTTYQPDGGGAGGGGATLSDYGTATGTVIPRGMENVTIPPGMTEEDIKAGIALIEKQQKQLKIWKVVGIGASIAFAAALIWAFVKD